MAMTDYIKKAVELADGWELSLNGTWIECMAWSSLSCNTALIPQYVLDALAAQLVRQCLERGHSFSVTLVGVRVRESSRVDSQTLAIGSSNDDHTMNTIKAIVDFAEANPGVLE